MRFTKFKPLSQTEILKLQDANRSIASRKVKDAAAQETRLQKHWEKMHRYPPPPAPTPENEVSIASAEAADKNGDFYIDSPQFGLNIMIFTRNLRLR
jgi:hypothetical protein